MSSGSCEDGCAIWTSLDPTLLIVVDGFEAAKCPPEPLKSRRAEPITRLRIAWVEVSSQACGLISRARKLSTGTVIDIGPVRIPTADPSAPDGFRESARGAGAAMVVTAKG